MSTTAQGIFDAAMGLIDEVSVSGETDTSSTTEYKNRTLLILNALRGELYPYSDTYASADSGRAVCPLIEDFDTAIDIDDVIAQSIIPYGLAAHLILDENPSAASFFEQRYEELRERFKNPPAEFEAIEDVYGIEYFTGGSW